MYFKLVVYKFPNEINVEKLKAIRLLGVMNLKDAIELCDNLRGKESVVLATGLSGDVCDYYVEILSFVGLDVKKLECEEKYPMRVDSRVNKKYSYFMRFIKIKR